MKDDRTSGLFYLAPTNNWNQDKADLTSGMTLQGGWSGWPTRNGKKLNNSQACCLAQLCLAAA